MQHNQFIDNDSLLWILFTVKEINNQSSNGRSTIDSKSIGESIKLIAPKEIAMDIGHTWGEYESMSSRVSEVTTKASKVMTEAGSVAGAAKDVVTGDMSGARGKILNVPIQWHRQDTAITYTGSDRRNFRFDFELAAYSDPKKEVFDIVRKFEMYSSPCEVSKDLTRIKPPYIFSINTIYGNGTPVDLINVQNAALMAVSPSYSFPYINGNGEVKSGYPSKCALSLSFREIEPLFRKNFTGGLINTKRE